jgi:hypothetical protein
MTGTAFSITRGIHKRDDSAILTAVDGMQVDRTISQVRLLVDRSSRQETNRQKPKGVPGTCRGSVFDQVQVDGRKSQVRRNKPPRPAQLFGTHIFISSRNSRANYVSNPNLKARLTEHSLFFSFSFAAENKHVGTYHFRIFRYFESTPTPIFILSAFYIFFHTPFHLIFTYLPQKCNKTNNININNGDFKRDGDGTGRRV